MPLGIINLTNPITFMSIKTTLSARRMMKWITNAKTGNVEGARLEELAFPLGLLVGADYDYQ